MIAARAVVAHPGHQIAQSGPARRGPGIPGMPQVMEMQAAGFDGRYSVWPARLPVEVPAAQGTAERPRKDERIGLGPGVRRQVVGQHWQDDARDADDAAPRTRLWRPEDHFTGRPFGVGPLHTHGTGH